MRLLQLTDDSTFSLTKDLLGDDPIPPYAILSHTWGQENDEVTFEDIINAAGYNKPGFQKIRFCGEQARKDRLEYFWIDTCCIDKSSSAELSEAINSMFQWYRKAAKCFAYLSDVSIYGCDTNSDISQSKFESAFRNSRWFTRGWTLQELIAPSSVEFFSREGERLGDKKSLEQQIHELTGIPVKALQGSPLSQFTVEERMSWAAKRTTKRNEDEAYCLLGIFDIFMPLLYGEGKEKAFIRLREEIDKPLSKSLSFLSIPFRGVMNEELRPLKSDLETDSPLNHLPYAIDAPFNARLKEHEPTCLSDTRVDLLRDIYAWADGHHERFIFWLSGLAGTGKSTIARTVARKYFENGQLGASFFFSKGGGDVGHASKFFTTIAVQLAKKSQPFRRHICDALRMNNDIATQSLGDQWRQLILGPLSKLNGDSYSSYVLVIDALDECDNDRDIRIILQLLAEAQSLKTIRLRVLLTSRPEIPIRHGFYEIPEAEHQDFVLHNIAPSIVDHDIMIFLEYNLRLIRQERSLDVGWPGEEVIRCLVQNASGLFIWAATACRFIREGKRFTVKRLAMVLENSSHAITAPEKHLNDIYMTVLKNSVSSDYSNEEREELYGMLRYILGSIVILSSPLSPYSLSKLLHVSKEEVDQTLDDLHAILEVTKDQTRPLRLHHPSFRDFLLNKDRCDDSNFWVDEKQAHQMLAGSCIQLLSASLKEDICGVTIPGTLIADVESGRVEECLPLEVQYACLHWVQHLQRSGSQLRDNDDVDQFLRNHFLHWLEALSWMKKISEGILEMISLESIAPVSQLIINYGQLN
jgi:heterokaryon incompatibility protein (HET)